MPILDWIETHQTTVDLLKWAALIVAAWVSGLFAFLARYRRKPILEIAETASYVFVEQFDELEGEKHVMRAAFVINASVVNASNEKIVVDHFILSHKAQDRRRSHKQEVLRIGFPARPRKRLGASMKWMGVWFSQYPGEEVSLTLIDGTLEPKDSAGGYLLFHTLTHGSWNPVIEDGRVHVKLRCKLTSQKWLKTTVNLRVRTDATELEEFSPGLVEHLQHPSTWHHDLTLHK